MCDEVSTTSEVVNVTDILRHFATSARDEEGMRSLWVSEWCVMLLMALKKKKKVLDHFNHG